MTTPKIKFNRLSDSSGKQQFAQNKKNIYLIIIILMIYIVIYKLIFIT